MTSGFASRPVFVTGHTGFKGSWLCQWLDHLGARVTGYALNPPTEPSAFDASRVEEFLSAHHVADIRDEASLHAALDESGAEVVFHLAAQSLVRESYRTPRETFEVNIDGTACLLDSVRRIGRPCVVVVATSDKCYENHERAEGYRESDRMGGRDPYSASKGAAELVVASYRESFFPPERLAEHGVKLASVRAGNVIGGGDWAEDRIVADVVRALSVGKPVQIRNPRAVRPWQHVLEPLCGYLTLAARMLQSDDPGLCSAWNFGPGLDGEIPVRDLVQRLLSSWGEGELEEAEEPGAPHEAHVLRLAIDKASSELGWRPRWDIDEAVRRTAEWCRCFQQGDGSMRELTRRQIRAYEAAEPEADA